MKRATPKQSKLVVNKSYEGETLEMELERMTTNKEPIKNASPPLYTERKEGVRPSTDIRTDRFEVAVEATTKIAGSYQARREEKPDMKVLKVDKTDGKAEPIQGTEKPTGN